MKAKIPAKKVAPKKVVKKIAPKAKVNPDETAFKKGLKPGTFEELCGILKRLDTLIDENKNKEKNMLGYIFAIANIDTAIVQLNVKADGHTIKQVAFDLMKELN